MHVLCLVHAQKDSMEAENTLHHSLIAALELFWWRRFQGQFDR